MCQPQNVHLPYSFIPILRGFFASYHNELNSFCHQNYFGRQEVVMKLIQSKGAGNSLSGSWKTQFFTNIHVILTRVTKPKFTLTLDQSDLDLVSIMSWAGPPKYNSKPALLICHSFGLMYGEYMLSVPDSPSLQITLSCWQGIDTQIT